MKLLLILIWNLDKNTSQILSKLFIFRYFEQNKTILKPHRLISNKANYFELPCGPGSTHRGSLRGWNTGNWHSISKQTKYQKNRKNLKIKKIVLKPLKVTSRRSILRQSLIYLGEPHIVEILTKNVFFIVENSDGLNFYNFPSRGPLEACPGPKNQ